jgi:hypothetical protein
MKWEQVVLKDDVTAKRSSLVRTTALPPSS